MHRTRLRTVLAAIAGIRAHYGPARRDDAGGSGTSTGSGSTEGGSGSTETGDSDTDSDSGDGGSKKPEIKGDVDRDRLARTLAAAREGEKKAKERASAAEKKHQDALDAIAVALGLKPDPKADPAELVKQAAAERDKALAAARAQAVELAVYKSAGKANADPDALLDSRSFQAAVAELDPADKNFGTKVADAIKDAVKTNPKLAATAQGSQGPARQGADITGSGGGTKQRPTSLGAAIAARMSGGR